MNWQDISLLQVLHGQLRLTETLVAVVELPWVCYQGHYDIGINRLEPLPPLERAVAGVLLHAGPQTFAALGRYLGLLVTDAPERLEFKDPAEYGFLKNALDALEEDRMVEAVEAGYQLTALGKEYAPLFCRPVQEDCQLPLLLGAQAADDAALARLRPHVDSNWSRTYLSVPTDRARLAQALAAQHPDKFNPAKGDQIAWFEPVHIESQALDRVVAIVAQLHSPDLRLLPCLRMGERHIVIEGAAPAWEELPHSTQQALGLPILRDPARVQAFGTALAAQEARLSLQTDAESMAAHAAWLLQQDFLHFHDWMRVLAQMVPPDAHWISLRVPRALHSLLALVGDLLDKHPHLTCFLTVEAQADWARLPALDQLIQHCAATSRHHFLLLEAPEAGSQARPLDLLIGTEAGVHGWQACAVEIPLPGLGTAHTPLLARLAAAEAQALVAEARHAVALHHLGLLTQQVQRWAKELDQAPATHQLPGQLQALLDRAARLVAGGDDSLAAADAALRQACADLLSRLHAHFLADWAAARARWCSTPLTQTKAAQDFRRQLRDHRKAIQQVAAPWPDFCQAALAAADADCQPALDAFAALPQTWVLDTNAFLQQPDLLSRLALSDRIVMPNIVLTELDKHKHKRDTGKAARQANAALDEALDAEKDLPAAERRIQVHTVKLHHLPDGYRNDVPDHHVLAVVHQLLATARVVLLTDDKNLRAKAKSLDIPTQGLDQVPGLGKAASSGGPDWAALFHRTKRQQGGRVHIDDFMAEVYKAQPTLDLQQMGFLTPAAYVMSLPGFSIRNQHFIHFTPL